MGGSTASPISSRARSRIIAMSSTSAASTGVTPSRAHIRSNPDLTGLSCVGTIIELLLKSSVRDDVVFRRAGVPITLTGCCDRGWVTKADKVSGAGTRFVRTTSRLSVSRPRNSSIEVPDRNTSSMSVCPSSGRRNSIWKLRDSVASAPTRSTWRGLPSRWSVARRSLPAPNIVSA